ncbi:hypothetical protein M434DRAFT_54963, partial [Hypoxylon sp. CO27-5]
MSLNRRCKAITSFAVSETPSSSASVVEVDTVGRRAAFQAIGPLCKLIIHPWDDR